jgi:hypothetical protein
MVQVEALSGVRALNIQEQPFAVWPDTSKFAIYLLSYDY